KLGVMYRTNMKIDYEGKGDFDIDPTFRNQLPPDGDISTTITLPGAMWGGIAYSPMRNLELEANAVWMNWSTFDELRVNLPGGAMTVSPQDYEDKVTWRIGTEYTLEKHKAAVRAGFIYDPTPIPRERLT